MSASDEGLIPSEKEALLSVLRMITERIEQEVSGFAGMKLDIVYRYSSADRSGDCIVRATLVSDKGSCGKDCGSCDCGKKKPDIKQEVEDLLRDVRGEVKPEDKDNN